MSGLLKIGEVAKLLGITPKTVRHYHKIKLLSEPTRSESGYRLYTANDLIKMQRIRRLQALGLSLKQIKVVLGEALPERTLKNVLNSLQHELTAQIQLLTERRERVQQLLEQGDLTQLRQPSELPPTLKLLKAQLGEQLADISPEVWEQEAKLYDVLDGFQWPDSYQEMIESSIQFIKEHPEQYLQLLTLTERFVALAQHSEDSMEVVDVAQGFLACQESFKPQLFAEITTWTAGSFSTIWPDLLTSNLSVAQRRCLEIVFEKSTNQHIFK